jgi:hypothetical protein
MQFLREFFGDRLISKGLWPPCSPDLSPADFFLSGYLKGTVYKNNLHTLDDLRRNITTAINSISLQVLHKLASKMVKRAQNDLASVLLSNDMGFSAAFKYNISTGKFVFASKYHVIKRAREIEVNFCAFLSSRLIGTSGQLHEATTLPLN